MEDKKDTLRIYGSLPVYAGAYRVGTESMNFAFNLAEKPKWLHRKFCELLLGWKWVDSENFGN